MNADEIAALLDGKDYHVYGTPHMRLAAEEARLAGVVIVYTHSDDCLELEGALDEEFYGDCVIDDGVALPRTGDEQRGVVGIDFNSGPYAVDVAWPHHKFELTEDGEVVCVGVTFNLGDVT